VSDMNDFGTEDLGPDDDALTAELRTAGQLDEVPLETMAGAKASFFWRTVDAELAELVGDSADDDLLLSGVRSTSMVRMLTFRSPSLTVEVEALDVGGRRRLIGQLVPAQAGRVTVRHAGGTPAVVADELGRFTVDDVAPGPVSLHCSGVAGAGELTTDWVVI